MLLILLNCFRKRKKPPYHVRRLLKKDKGQELLCSLDYMKAKVSLNNLGNRPHIQSKGCF